MTAYKKKQLRKKQKNINKVYNNNKANKYQINNQHKNFKKI